LGQAMLLWLSGLPWGFESADLRSAQTWVLEREDLTEHPLEQATVWVPVPSFVASSSEPRLELRSPSNQSPMNQNHTRRHTLCCPASPRCTECLPDTSDTPSRRRRGSNRSRNTAYTARLAGHHGSTAARTVVEGGVVSPHPSQRGKRSLLIASSVGCSRRSGGKVLQQVRPVPRSTCRKLGCQRMTSSPNKADVSPTPLALISRHMCHESDRS
jgi:hypothetical protein